MLSERNIPSIIEENVLLKTLVQEQEITLSNYTKSLSKLESEIEEKDAKIEKLQEQVEWFKRMAFGQKRERYVATPEGQLTLPFDVDQEQVAQAVEALKAEDVKKEVSVRKKREGHPGRTPLPTHLEVVETIIEPEGDLSNMVHIGDEITEELEVMPAKYYIHKIIRRKYAPKSGEGAFMIAQLPERVLDKAIFGANLITQVLIDKYVYHQPLYRIRQRLAREGIDIKEATLYCTVHKGIAKLQILYNFLWEQQVRCGYLQADETTLKVLESEKKNAAHLGYIWGYNDPINNIPIFKYESGRGGVFPLHQLNEFEGFLQTDGYAGYNKLAKADRITHLACWAHARREFEKALPNNKSMAGTALTQIQALYKIEREIKDLAPDQKKEKRLEQALPILNGFFKWLGAIQPTVLPKSQMGKAIKYTKDRYESLMAYLLNGNLAIDNNLIENSIRPIALGRKNHLFAHNHESAQRAAIIYTFMGICIKHNVNPFNWLKATLLAIDQTSIQNLKSLLPQNFNKGNGIA